MMNLAVFTEDHTALEANHQLIAELTRNHTCRALSIALDRNASEASTTSWVSAHCNMSNGKKTVCSEQISFLLTGYVTGRMRNTVFSNLNSDLPLIFWWQGELSEVFEPRLYTLIDRFIFNSSDWFNPAEGYSRLLEAADDVKRRFVIQDLAWTQSYYFRLAFASLFDEALAQQQFPHISEVAVQVGEGKRSVGLLLIAWLANQAGWSLKGGNQNGLFTFENPEGLLIQASLTESGSEPIYELGIASDDAGFLLRKNEGENFIQQYIQGENGIQQMTASAGSNEQIDLVADQLSRGGKNALLRKTIPLFMELCNA